MKTTNCPLCTKLFLAILITLSINNTKAQTTEPSKSTTPAQTAPANQPTKEDEGTLKHVRFGLRISPSYNYYKVETKNTSSEGGVAKFGGGLLMEFNLTKTVSLQTGIGIDLDGGKLSYTNDLNPTSGASTTRYYFSKVDEEIVEFENEFVGNANYKEYVLKERTYASSYITVPLNLKMKTNYFNYVRYFGQLGFDFQIRSKGKAEDLVQEVVYDANNKLDYYASETSLSDLKIEKELSFLNSALNLGAGFEYKISESTSLAVGLNYGIGLGNAFDDESIYIRKGAINASGSTDYAPYKQEIQTRRLALNIAVLF